MKLSLQLILETLTEYGAQLIETDGDFTFTGVQILTSPTDILEPDTLYVCTPKVLPKLKKQLFENHCFVFKAKPSQLQCHHALHGILLDENTDLNEVVNRLITLFTQFHAFEFAIINRSNSPGTPQQLFATLRRQPNSTEKSVNATISCVQSFPTGTLLYWEQVY